MLKNVAGQYAYVYAHDSVLNVPKLLDAANITATLGGVATDDVNPTEISGGVYRFTLTQAETNFDDTILIAVSATEGVQIDYVFLSTDHGITANTTDIQDKAQAGAAAAIDAPVENPTEGSLGYRAKEAAAKNNPLDATQTKAVIAEEMETLGIG
jgi:hypothetical protein